MVRQTGEGVEVDIRVIPRARITAVAGVRGDAYLVRLAAPPVENAANDRLIEFLAERLGVARRDVRIVSGEGRRQKRVAIARVTVDAVRARLGPVNAPPPRPRRA